MSELNNIKRPIEKELIEFDSFFKEIIRTNVKLLDTIVKYMIKAKGKQIRPLFVFLSAKMHGQISRRTYLAATSIELLHSATLIHDDVVDDSDERRGMLSINAIWKNKLAVLTGDFLLSRGMLIATTEKEYQALDIIASAVKEMSEGEIYQLDKSRKLNINEEEYYDIIRKKTASLIGTSMAVGTHSVTTDETIVAKMKKIGITAGLAFQIKDDIFDYQTSSLIGKPSGNDIKEKKITLPLIFALKQMNDKERRKSLRIVKSDKQKKDEVKALINRVVELGGIDYATKKMTQFISQAKDMLMEFPQNESRDSLLELMDYIIARKK